MVLEKKTSVPNGAEKDNTENGNNKKQRDFSRPGNKSGSFMRRDRRNSKPRPK